MLIDELLFKSFVFYYFKVIKVCVTCQNHIIYKLHFFVNFNQNNIVILTKIEKFIKFNTNQLNMAYINRDIEKDIGKWIESREIIAIRGPRQSGKTTLLMRIKDSLKAKGVDEQRIHYINFEDDLIRLKFEENAKEFIEFQLNSEKHYFMLDEVQYVKDVGKKLKLIFDSFSNAKLIITGLSSFDLTNLGSYLVGRVIFFNLYPFNFLEFLRSKEEKYENLYKKVRIDLDNRKINLKKTVFLDDLNKLLHEYLTFGSYPRIVLEKNYENKKELLKNMFITYIEKDIVGLYGIKYREKVVKLLKAIALSSGNMVNYETLRLNSGLSYNEVRDILPLLEDSFVIYIVRPFYKNLINELRKNPKIYFVDYGIRNHLLEQFENLNFDKLYENFVHNELKRNYTLKYWRTASKTEVDFVVEHKNTAIPIEVKTKPKLTRSYRSFIQHYKPTIALMPNLNTLYKIKINGCDVFVVPFVYL